MSDEVVISKESVGVVAIVLGWGASVLHQGRKIGRVEESFAVMKKDVQDLKDDVAQLQKEHEEDFRAIQNWFRTDSGGQKFMTFPDHDIICSRNSKATAQAITQMTDAVRGLTEQISTMGRQLQSLEVSVAVMQSTPHKPGQKS